MLEAVPKVPGQPFLFLRSLGFNLGGFTVHRITNPISRAFSKGECPADLKLCLPIQRNESPAPPGSETAAGGFKPPRLEG
jgi:hypothetical protein